ncbi:MAG: hypothetical protein AAB605_03500 [Patescibacteria group bacterium]
MGPQSRRHEDKAKPTQAYYWDNMDGKWSTVIYFSDGHEEEKDGAYESPQAARAALKKRAAKLGYPDLLILASVL